MKKKNRINPIEQHFEKVILGGVTVVLLGVVSMQFLGEPNAVKVGNSATAVAPDRVFDPIAEEAERLLSQMRNPTPTLPEVPEQDVVQRFEQVRRLSSAGQMQINHFGVGVVIEGAESGLSGGELAATTYAMPALPVPATISLATHRGTIDPFVATANEELRAYLPREQPFDALAVSIEGVVDGSLLRESLEMDPDGDEGPVRPMPLSWWRGNLDLLGVEVEREEMTSGGWTGRVVLSGMPGGVSVIDEARQEGMTPGDILSIAQDSREYLRELVQPRFPTTIAGPDWVQPSERQEDEGLSDEDREISLLKRQVKRFDLQVASLEEQLGEVGSGGGSTGGRTGGGRGGRGGGGEGGGGSSDRPTVDLEEKKREGYRRQLETVQRSRQRAVEKLADLDVFIDEDQNQTQQTNEPEVPLPGILMAEEMPVWTHDFSAAPGKTYRYRLRVVLNNPLFGRGLYLSDSQKSAADAATLEGNWSAWSSPIEVEMDRHFFVVSASDDDRFGSGPRAAVEVYEFYYGYWRKGSTTLEPGDTIHARAKLPENLLLWDPEMLKDFGRAPGMGGGPLGRPGGGRDPGGERGRFTDPEGDERSRFGGGSEPRGRGQPGGEEAELPEGATQGPESLDLHVAAMLLDVVPVPGIDGVFQAVIRGPRGSIVMRDTSGDRSGLLYRRLSANAREGVDQGRPEADPTDSRNPTDMPGGRERWGEEEGEGGNPGG